SCFCFASITETLRLIVRPPGFSGTCTVSAVARRIAIMSSALYDAGMRSLQETYAPSNRCFGCGPANEKGLRIRSFEDDDALDCDCDPEPHHLAFAGIRNAGIRGAILDCHSNWAATIHLMRGAGASAPP